MCGLCGLVHYLEEKVAFYLQDSSHFSFYFLNKIILIMPLVIHILKFLKNAAIVSVESFAIKR